MASEVGRRKKKSSGATKTRFAECYRVRAGEKGLDGPEMNEEKDRPSCRRERERRRGGRERGRGGAAENHRGGAGRDFCIV